MPPKVIDLTSTRTEISYHCTITLTEISFCTKIDPTKLSLASLHLTSGFVTLPAYLAALFTASFSAPSANLPHTLRIHSHIEVVLGMVTILGITWVCYAGMSSSPRDHTFGDADVPGGVGVGDLAGGGGGLRLQSTAESLSVAGEEEKDGANRRACKDVGGGGSGALCGQPSFVVSGKVELCNVIRVL